jgi:hypothetical protein
MSQLLQLVLMTINALDRNSRDRVAERARIENSRASSSSSSVRAAYEVAQLNVGHSPGSVAATSAVAAAARAEAASKKPSTPAGPTTPSLSSTTSNAIEREGAPSADGFPYISEALEYAPLINAIICICVRVHSFSVGW